MCRPGLHVHVMNSPSSPPLHLPCPHCGATNRLPVTRIDESPNCGRCGQPLLAGQPLDLDDDSFDGVVAATKLPVLVDFWAAWCGPCQAMAPAFKQAAQQLAGQALLVKVNSDDSPRLAARFAIRSIPTLVKLQSGREVQRQSGALPASAIMRLAQG
jgi:thioredoxin 2